MDWVCKIKKGIDVVDPTVPPEGYPDSSCGSENDGLWIKFDSLCYLFHFNTSSDYYTAERVGVCLCWCDLMFFSEDYSCQLEMCKNLTTVWKSLKNGYFCLKSPKFLKCFVTLCVRSRHNQNACRHQQISP